MLKRFSDHGEALDFGREMATRLQCCAYLCSVYVDGKRVSFVAGPSSRHLLPTVQSDYSALGGWYFGGCAGVGPAEGAALLATPDADPMPGKGEYWYALCAGHTQGFTHAQLREMAENCEKYNTGVWHEAARISGHLDACPCGACKKKAA